MILGDYVSEVLQVFLTSFGSITVMVFSLRLFLRDY